MSTSWSLVGIGLRQPHAQELARLRPPLGFVEVHSENFFAEGGGALEALAQVRANYPISLHGVGLSLGSASGIDTAHLDKLAKLVARIDPVRVSDHASFGYVAGGEARPVHAADLLPLAFTPASQDVLVANIQQVQDRLQRPILIENLSAYMAYTDDAIPEVDFLTQTCRRAGCQLLLDLNNLVVNGLNRARRATWQQTPGAEPDQASALAQARAEALDFVWSIPPGMVGQIHLAGFRWAAPNRLIVDDHSQRVHPVVWDVYAQALAHLDEVPTLVEWDVDLPPLAVLLDEARLAAQALAQHRGEHDGDAGGEHESLD